jgi:hypothetical protein
MSGTHGHLAKRDRLLEPPPGPAVGKQDDQDRPFLVFQFYSDGIAAAGKAHVRDNGNGPEVRGT